MRNKGIQKRFSLILVMAMILGSFLSNSNLTYSTITYAASMEGRGTSDDPYLIRTVDDLYNMRGNSRTYFKLMNDLDLKNEMRSHVTNKFSSVLDGNNHTIYNLYTEDQGFFNELHYATIKNITFKNAKVSPSYGIAGIISAKAYNSNFIRCFVLDSEISVNSIELGNIVGRSDFSNLFQCYSNSDINSATGEKIGGLVGISNSSTLTQCVATGDITGKSAIGGLVGMDKGTMRTVIEDCYSTGTVTANDTVNGSASNLISGTGGEIKNSYAVSNVIAPVRYGLTPGSEIVNSYYNQDVMQLEGDNSHGRTTEQMYQSATYEGWDFVNTWSIDEGIGYPRLQFELESNMPELPLESISLDRTEAIMSVGESLQLNVIYTPMNAINKNVIWISTNPACFTVNENGVITAIAPGFGVIVVFSETGNYMVYTNVLVN